MPKKPSLKQEIARKYLAKFPKTATSVLARTIYNDNPEVWTKWEDVRKSLLGIEGKNGARSRKGATDKSAFRTETKPYNPYRLPDSFAEDRAPFKLPKVCNNILVISDLHIPYHNIDAISIAIKYGKEQKVNTIFINGDLIDFHKVSRFQADPTKRSIAQELEATRQFLLSLRKVFPKADMYWLKGNHDVRLEHYLVAKAPELLGIDDFELKSLLRLAEVGVTILDDKTLVKMGKLSVSHGHLITKGIFAPVNVARGVYTKTKQSTLVGHSHKTSEHSETDMDGNLVTCYSVACLCELRSDYNPLIANNGHGFAHVKVRENNNYSVRNYRIFKGQLL